MRKSSTSQTQSDSTPLSVPRSEVGGRLSAQNRLPHLLKEALTDEVSPLRAQLSPTQIHFLRAMYLPQVPDVSDGRGSQFQHRANGCSLLFNALRDRGYTREDIKAGLEKIRYLDFIERADRWIDDGGESPTSPMPGDFTFDVRSRAHAKSAFEGFARHLRIPPNFFDHGTITPFFRPSLGFGFRVSQGGEVHSFLCASLDGVRLAPINEDTQALARGMASESRHLMNLLQRRAPVDLNLAFAPRPITYAGTLRIALFPKNDPRCPPAYVYLPPSVRESALVPNVDGQALMRGERVVELRGKESKKLVATVTLHAETVTLATLKLAPDVSASLYTRFRPVSLYLRGLIQEPPDPIRTDINRREIGNGVNQRVLLGCQMVVPAWYPFRTITVHPIVSPTGSRHVGLYPLGVSPVSTPPLKAFMLDEAKTEWHPIEVTAAWNGPNAERDRLFKLIERVTGSNATVSRDAWVEFHEWVKNDPVLLHSLLCVRENPVSLRNVPGVKKLFELPGWESYEARIRRAVCAYQASSVPFVANLLLEAGAPRSYKVEWLLKKMPDYATGPEAKPLDLLTRLAVTAPKELEATLAEIRSSPLTEFARLVGDYRSVSELIGGLSRVAPDPLRLRPWREDREYGATELSSES